MLTYSWALQAGGWLHIEVHINCPDFKIICYIYTHFHPEIKAIYFEEKGIQYYIWHQYIKPTVLKRSKCFHLLSSNKSVWSIPLYRSKNPNSSWHQTNLFEVNQNVVFASNQSVWSQPKTVCKHTLYPYALSKYVL